MELSNAIPVPRECAIPEYGQRSNVSGDSYRACCNPMRPRHCHAFGHNGWHNDVERDLLTSVITAICRRIEALGGH